MCQWNLLVQQVFKYRMWSMRSAKFLCLRESYGLDHKQSSKIQDFTVFLRSIEITSISAHNFSRNLHHIFSRFGWFELSRKIEILLCKFEDLCLRFQAILLVFECQFMTNIVANEWGHYTDFVAHKTIFMANKSGKFFFPACACASFFFFSFNDI